MPKLETMPEYKKITDLPTELFQQIFGEIQQDATREIINTGYHSESMVTNKRPVLFPQFSIYDEHEFYYPRVTEFIALIRSSSVLSYQARSYFYEHATFPLIVDGDSMHMFQREWSNLNSQSVGEYTTLAGYLRPVQSIDMLYKPDWFCEMSLITQDLHSVASALRASVPGLKRLHVRLEYRYLPRAEKMVSDLEPLEILSGRGIELRVQTFRGYLVNNKWEHWNGSWDREEAKPPFLNRVVDAEVEGYISRLAEKLKIKNTLAVEEAEVSELTGDDNLDVHISTAENQKKKRKNSALVDEECREGAGNQSKKNKDVKTIGWNDTL
jgi:hypothetical protein